MSQLHYGLIFAFCIWPITTSFGQNGDGKPMAKLNNRTESLLTQKILPAYRMSDRLQLLEGLSTATARVKPDQLEAFDERLRMLGLPNSAKMMVEAYMSLLTQGRNDDLPEPKLREIVVMVPELEKSIKEVLDAIDDAVATIDPLPVLERLEDYEGLFWEIHVLDNKILNASHFARYGAHLIELAQRQRSKGYEETLEKLSVDFAERVTELERARIDLHGRKLEFRLDRMELAKKALGEADGFMEKMQAAFAGQVDAAIFRESFAAGELPAFDRERLQDPQLRELVENLAVEIEALSGDLKKKSQLFFVGTHWWLRGRYGHGTDHGGLLKSVAAVKDPRFLFPLFIPEAMGKPPHQLIRNPDWQRSDEAGGVVTGVSPYIRVKTEGDMKPDVPRRHHFAWMYEYRRIGPAKVVGESDHEVIGVSRKNFAATTMLSRFY